MTSSTTTGTGQQTTEGRSVRDIVEHEPDQVTEAWCRKIFRKLLQSLELQYAMQMPHRAITADTVVFHDNGEPLLLPSIISDPEPEQAGDLTALGRLIHYAITQELIPTGPLHGRGLEGYSESLLTAVDRCMDPDLAARPQTIEELRSLLGIVAPGSIPVAAPAIDPAPAPAPEAIPEALPEAAREAIPESAAASAAAPTAPPSAQPLRAAATATPATSAESSRASAAAPAPITANSGQRRPDPGHPKRQAVAVTAAVLLAVLLGGYALRAPGPTALTAPTAPALVQGASASAPAQDSAPAGTAAPAAQVATSLPAGVSPAAGIAQDPGAPPSPAAPAVPAEAASEEAVPDGGAAYRLQIQPWGTVYVDGVDRGVSPPIKRLALAPGRHTIRVTNPNFQDRVLDVDTANGDGRIAVDFSEAE